MKTTAIRKRKRMKTLSVINQKGGVAKSTTCQMLAAALRRRGASTLLVDLDAQGNLTAAAGASPDEAETALILQGESITPADSSQGPIYTSTPVLASADLTLTETGKEYRLKEALAGMTFDYCIIDTPPALGILTVNALTASDYVIIPARADLFSIQGIGQLSKTIDAVKKYCNPDLQIAGILLTMYSKRTVLQRETADILQDTAKQMGTSLFEAKIRPCSALPEAQARRQDIFTYSPRSNAAADYDAFTDELLERI